MIKITKLPHAFIGFASLYNADILNCFDPELRLTQKSLGKNSTWITDSVVDHNIRWNQLYKITERIKPSRKRID